MPRAWLDEEFDDDPETWIVGNAPAGLFCRSLSACAKNGLDGWLPEAWAFARVPGNRRNPDAEGQIAALVDNGWWDPMPGGSTRDVVVIRDPDSFTLTVGPHRSAGFYVVNFLQKNPSSVEIAAMRKNKQAAGRKGALRRWAA